MRPIKVALWGYALLALAWASPAQAAWNNVFQVCCNSCKQPQIAAYPPAPVATSNYQQNCTTRYTQRSYYQPVTTYRTSYYTEPVTTYRTSYYYEPVTSYRYSSYYDPCTCRYQQVATPCTSYRLRQQTCPVTSYLQRACLQPVTTYQQINYYIPETTCCNTTVGEPILGAPPAANGPGISSEPPAVGEQRIAPNPMQPPLNNPVPPVGEGREPFSGGARYERNYSAPQFGTPYPSQTAPAVPASPRPPATIRLDRTASTGGVSVRGQLVSTQQAPLRNTRVLFVNADQDRAQFSTTTAADGRFEINLAAGNWLVYTIGADGRPVFNQKVYVEGSGPRTVLLVSYSNR